MSSSNRFRIFTVSHQQMKSSQQAQEHLSPLSFLSRDSPFSPFFVIWFVFTLLLVGSCELTLLYFVFFSVDAKVFFTSQLLRLALAEQHSYRFLMSDKTK